jgi:hypothetical protein
MLRKVGLGISYFIAIVLRGFDRPACFLLLAAWMPGTGQRT